MSSVSGINSVSPFDVSSTAQKATSAKAHANTTGATSKATSTDSALTSSVGTTFMNLLVKELQNQDPTSPMDSTAMVGQMISLNQLDQLMSINQDLSGKTSSSTTSDVSAGSAGTIAARAALASTGPSTAAASSSSQSTSNTNSVLDLSGLANTNINGAN